MAVDQVLAEKTVRSVFVGNIPYEISEEKLKEIFSEVGPVLSFKLVFDRDSGKPKGYGFCEYKDQETALSAMRNLNNYEIGGRNLRVDNACTEKSRMEMQSLLQGSSNESQYGSFVTAEKAPETISKAVASLPPEQMYELMKQMKHCIQNNPTEARQMLLQNPQLAYALLQAQIVMRIVDPQTAFTMLHQSNQSSDIVPSSLSNDIPVISSTNHSRMSNEYPATENHWNNVSSRPVVSSQPPPPSIQAPLAPTSSMGKSQDMDMRTADLRAATNRFADQDLRIPPSQMMSSMRDSSFDHFGRDMHISSNDNFTGTPRPIPPPVPMTAPMPVGPPVIRPPMPVAPPNLNNMQSRMPPQNPPLPRSSPSNSSGQKSVSQPTGGADNEKAALIMQVLQLTDEQIAMLPAEQRQSILVLKEQIAKSTKQR